MNKRTGVGADDHMIIWSYSRLSPVQIGDGILLGRNLVRPATEILEIQEVKCPPLANVGGPGDLPLGEDREMAASIQR